MLSITILTDCPTVGAYSAAYPDEVYAWPPYEFVIEEELIPGALILSGEVITGVDASLSWMTWNGPAAAPGWIYWGDGVQSDAIGTGGAADFAVAQKFPTSIMNLYNNSHLTSVRFFPYVDGATYTIKLWTGTDEDLAPVTQVYEQAVPTYTANAWNEIPITPYLINNANALYIGYSVSTTTGYPAGCDAGPQVPGLGNLIEWGGTWSELTALNASLTFNWCIEGYVDNIPVRGDTGLAQMSIPVQESPVNKDALRNSGFTSALGTATQPTRALLGYNVYRDNVLLNTAGYITDNIYYDAAPGIGLFNYQVKAVYVTADVMSNILPLNFSPIPSMELPFTEAWNTSSYVDNYWSPSASNWTIYTGAGYPAPCAAFSWSPQITNYTEYLTSYMFNGAGHTNINLSFDLSLNNYSTNAENFIAVEVWNGTTWNQLDSWSSFENNGAGWGFQYFSYDITPYAVGHDFKIRFVASGENSYEINFWYIDNINIYSTPAALASPEVTITASSPDVLLSWTGIPGAIWYAIYGATDPYGTYTYLGYLPATYTGAYFPAGNYEFFKVTAGAGALPRGRMLERGIRN